MSSVARPNGGRRDQVIYYQYRADRARRTLCGIDEQIKKAEQAVADNWPCCLPPNPAYGVKVRYRGQPE